MFELCGAERIRSEALGVIEKTVAWSSDQRFQRFIWGAAVDDLRSKHPLSTAGMPKGRSGTGKPGMVRDLPPFVRLVMVKVG